MPSFDVVNYSLRPSKSIQRNLVFEGVMRLQNQLHLNALAYVGFGSIWFTDFVLAHKLLRIDDMVSIEANEIGFRRAEYNSPYATVRVKRGQSSEIIPTLYQDEVIRDRPWMVWLDYDYAFNETTKDDVISLIENAPTNSILLITFNGQEKKYGSAPLDRPTRLRELFGPAVPDDLPKQACRDERMQETLADFARDYMLSVANDVGRAGGFVPAFRLIYRDNAPMVTVGGILPSSSAAHTAKQVTSSQSWPCRPSKAIVAPHLTMREAAALQSKLPSTVALTRTTVQQLGFDLEDAQLDAFQTYYRQYPAFAQIVP